MHSPTRRTRKIIRATTSACRTLMESLEGRRLLSFSPAVNYAVGSNAQAVVTADFNGDGRLDVATANYAGNNVSVLLGNAGGTFQAALNSPTGNSPLSLAVGDFNGDGKRDIATANVGNVSVLLGNGNGSFQAPSNIDIGSAPASVAVGDLNGDGKLDLGVTSNVYYPGSYGWYGGWYPGSYAGRANVMLGNGTGSFSAPTATSTGGGNLLSAAMADFNRDGKQDFAAVNYSSASVTVMLGAGTGVLGSPTSFNTGFYARALTVGEFTGDGILDLATAGQTVDILPGLGDGTFRPVVRQYIDPVALAPADFNGDGKLDVVTAENGSTVSVLLGTGAGAFRPAINMNTAAGSTSVAVGDFNGDGRPDVATANSTSNNVSVLLNDGAWPAADAPSISIGDVTVTEGNTGTVNASFSVSLSAASSQTISVQYGTADGTATAGGDYQTKSGTVTFAPGETTKTVSVLVNGDRIGESSESFVVLLSNAVNAFVADTTGVCVIVDNEPTISIDDYSAAEGNTGTKPFTITARLSAASDVPVSANFSTAEGDTEWWGGGGYYYYYPPPPATAGEDFQTASGTITFAPGETTKTITVMVNGDRAGESTEVFSVDLSNASGATFADGHALATIVDDEPYASVSGGSVFEGNSGTNDLPFTITLSNATDVPVTVNYTTADGSATTADGDYQAKTGSVTFAPGETSKTVNVTITGDRRGESDEYLSMSLTGATNAGISSGLAYATILDDEPRISINSASISEGNSGTRSMTFTVKLSAAYDQAVTVKYATQDSSAVSSSNDYVAKSGTLTFAAGQTTQTFTVTIRGDKKREGDESFYVLLSDPTTNALIETSYGWGTILNDDHRR